MVVLNQLLREIQPTFSILGAEVYKYPSKLQEPGFSLVGGLGGSPHELYVPPLQI